MNPKAVTTDELFGFLHPATREWKDGKCVDIELYLHDQKFSNLACVRFVCLT